MLNNTEVRDVIILFLKHHHELTKPDDTGYLVNSLFRQKTGKIAIDDDLTIWNDMQRSLQLVKKTNDLLTEEEAFEVMINFLEKYFMRTNSDDIRSVLGDLLHDTYGVTSDPGAWYDWQDCLMKVKATVNNKN